MDTKNVSLRDVQQLHDGISLAMEALRRIQVTITDPGLRGFPSFALDPFGVTGGALDHTGYRNNISPIGWPYAANGYGYAANGYGYPVPGYGTISPYLQSSLGYRSVGYDPRGMVHSPWNPVYGSMINSMVSPMGNAYASPITYMPLRSF